MVSIVNRYVLLFVFMFLGAFVFAQTVTKPIDPIPEIAPCTGGSEASLSECQMAGIDCIGKCFRSARNSSSGGTESFGFCYRCEWASPEIIEKPECRFDMVQYKTSGLCDTIENKCCPNGKWSGFGNDCEVTPSCTSNQCWNGRRCENKPSTPCACTNGTCLKQYLCSDGGGWEDVGSFCICNSGYTLKNGVCVKNAETVYIWDCRPVSSGACRNPVNNRHDVPCEALAPTCSAYLLGQEKYYYSCHDCERCTCVAQEFEIAFP